MTEKRTGRPRAKKRIEVKVAAAKHHQCGGCMLPVQADANAAVRVSFSRVTEKGDGTVTIQRWYHPPCAEQIGVRAMKWNDAHSTKSA